MAQQKPQGKKANPATVTGLIVVIVIAVIFVIWQAAKTFKKPEVPIAPFSIPSTEQKMKGKKQGVAGAPGGGSPAAKQQTPASGTQ